MADPLRTVTSRTLLTGDDGLRFPADVLECGHTIPQYAGLGAPPRQSKRRRCWQCGSAHDA